METAPEPSSSWSWRIGRLAGIAIEVHATFVLLLVWIAMTYLVLGEELAVAAKGLAMIGCVFAIVVVHELAHALVARMYGIATHAITLYPIGGMAKLDGMPRRPRQELAVALAGPAINALLGGAIYLGLRIDGAEIGAPFANNPFVVQLMWINVSLCVFNLLPAFPMDGGRILRALLAMRLSRTRATVIAARVGRAIAILLGVGALALGHIMLGAIAVFVWVAGTQEAQLELTRDALRGVSAGDAMVREFVAVSPNTAVAYAAGLLAHSFQRAFPVMFENRVVGVVRPRAILDALADGAPATLGDIMDRRFATADPGEPLADALVRLPEDGGPVVVAKDGDILGLLDAAHVEDALVLRA